MSEPVLAFDVETQGLRPYHDDRLFSLILATPTLSWYFNFQVYPGIDSEKVLPIELLKPLWNSIDDKSKVFIAHNAKFDLSFLAKEGIHLQGQVYCTKAMARVEYNNHLKYSLKNCLERIPGAPQKSDAVEEYITKHKLWTDVKIPGKKQVDRRKHFDRVPFSIITNYGLADGVGTAALQVHQMKTMKALDDQEPLMRDRGRSLEAVCKNEMRLTKTVFRMEQLGVKIDREYCNQAIKYEGDRYEKARTEFKAITGETYKASGKLFAAIFESEKDKWEYTKKGNPSFESDIIGHFSNPAAGQVLKCRDAKSKQDFYNGFLYHADGGDVVHPSFEPSGTVHGRFSSSNPNFQNLSKDEDVGEQEFTVRRAIVPRPGFKLVSIDYNQMEYVYALELSCQLKGQETELARLINYGYDFHQATVDQVLKTARKQIYRKTAKISNFLTLYGGGNGALAKSLNVSVEEAKSIRMAILHATPEINAFIQSCTRSAEAKGFVVNWLGRRSWFPDAKFSYKAPNYIVSGGCADIVKLGMNQLDDYSARMIMVVHDEIVFEVPENDEVDPHFVEIMAGAYKSKYVPLTCSVTQSHKSLGDLK